MGQSSNISTAPGTHQISQKVPLFSTSPKDGMGLRNSDSALTWRNMVRDLLFLESQEACSNNGREQAGTLPHPRQASQQRLLAAVLCDQSFVKSPVHCPAQPSQLHMSSSDKGRELAEDIPHSMALWGDETSGAGGGEARVTPSLPLPIAGIMRVRDTGMSLVVLPLTPHPPPLPVHPPRLLSASLPPAQQLLLVSGFLGTPLLGHQLTKP